MWSDPMRVVLIEKRDSLPRQGARKISDLGRSSYQMFM
jgi:hypothetical protein